MQCEGSLGLTWHDGIRTTYKDEDDQMDIYSLYIYSTGKFRENIGTLDTSLSTGVAIPSSFRGKSTN